MSLPRSACAAVGCALPSSHSSAAECRLSAARAPLWAACCLVALLPCRFRGYTFHWVLGRRQWNRNPTHPLTTPKQQTCQWEGRWMIFFYRPKCSYRFMFFFYRVETSAPGLSGYYWYLNISAVDYIHYIYIFTLYMQLYSYIIFYYIHKRSRFTSGTHPMKQEQKVPCCKEKKSNTALFCKWKSKRKSEFTRLIWF